jgi:thymidylate synthase (FAD)
MQILDKGYVTLEDHMGSDNSIVSAARVSHLGESKGMLEDEKLIKYLIKNSHTSPFEHVVFTFRVKCPIFVARQWMRHRTWSFNEVSRRYTSEEIDFHVPTELRMQDNTDKQSSNGILEESPEISAYIEKVYNACYQAYDYMLQCGVAREQARMVLPVGMYTSFYGTIDLHNLFQFFKLRTSPHAQLEIKVYSQAMEQLIAPIVPMAYNAWKELQK